MRHRTSHFPLPPRLRVSPRPPARAAHEPVETENMINDSLDLIEQHVHVVLTNGGEMALRARLARLLGESERQKP